MNQDNPFAKGVSINQDMVMEDETPTLSEVVINAMQNWVADKMATFLISLGIPLIGNQYSIRHRRFYLVVTKGGFRFEGCHSVKNKTIYCHHLGTEHIKAMLARPCRNYSDTDRQLLALGREEE